MIKIQFVTRQVPVQQIRKRGNRSWGARLLQEKPSQRLAGKNVSSMTYFCRVERKSQTPLR